jgi:uncharacterized repeat protein (TIGR01451 family)
MASILGALRRLFTGKSRGLQTARSSRKAAYEPLEPRNLLAGDVLVSLTGTAYIDQTDNGLTSDDEMLSGAVVQLYRDGGDATFDGGTGDDTFVASAVTGEGGTYQFSGLQPGAYFVEQLPQADLLQRAAARVQSVDVSIADLAGRMRSPIDTFETSQIIEVWQDRRVLTSATAAPEAIGGERDLLAELTSSYGILQLGANAYGLPVLEFDSSAAAEGRRLVTWDGNDGDGSDVAYRGLGGYDLTAGGTVSGIQFSFGADHSTGRMSLRVYTDSENWSQAILDIPRTGGLGTSPVVMQLTDFVPGAGRGADLTNVGALQLEIEGDAAIDGQIDRIDTFGPAFHEVNFANLKPLSLGDRVWFDADNSGVFNPTTEQGIGQVALNLYEDSNTDGVYSPEVDQSIDSQVTASDGSYEFTGLLPGSYVVQVEPGNFAAGGALEGLVLTGDGSIIDPDNDVNHDNNGYVLAGHGVVSQAVTLVSGAEPTSDGDGDGNSNLSVDVGFALFDLSITKTDDADPAIAGELLTYTLLVTNHGPADASDVTIVDPLPADVILRSVTSSQGDYTTDGGEITVSLGDLSAGGSATVAIAVEVDPDFVGQLSNEAVVSGRRSTDTPIPGDPWSETNLSNNRDQQVTPVEASTDLEIVKTDLPDPAVPGEPMTYRLTVTNNGPSTATGVTAVDDLPDGVVFESVSSSQGTAQHAEGRVTASLGTLKPGASATVDIVVRIQADQTEPIENDATVDGAEPDPDPGNNYDDETTQISPLIDLTIDKIDDPPTVVAGQELTYTLLVTNNGPSVATGVTATDTLPSGVAFQSAAVSQGSVDQTAGVVTADVGTLAPGGSATVTIVTLVDPDQASDLVNVAEVRGNEEEANPTDNQDSEATDVTNRVDLAVTKLDTPDPVVAGTELTYEIVVSNNGPSLATGVVAIDELPVGTRFRTATASQGAVNHEAGIVTAELGSLAPGESAVITLIVDVDSSAPNVLVNPVRVNAIEPDVDPGNDFAEQETMVLGVYDLEIVKTDSQDPVVAGDDLTYTLVVTNNGPSDADDVIVIDDLPDEVSFIAAQTTQGSVELDGSRVRIDLGYLANGQTETISIDVQVDTTVSGEIENIAIVEGKPAQVNPTGIGSFIHEFNLDNNLDDQRTTVQAALSTISGYVYIDFADDGIFDATDRPIPGVEVMLTGVDMLENSVNLFQTTDEQGAYRFVDLLPGTYTVAEVQPVAFVDGKDTPGYLDGSTAVLTFDVSDDMFAEIGLDGGMDAVEFNFGELMYTKRDFLSATTDP